MVESLLSISEVQLYGEPVTDMTYRGKKGDPVKKFTRVFGFGFEGAYYALDAPIIMLLENAGKELTDKDTPKDVKNSFTTDIRVWTVDKSDKSVRLDELTGTIEDILLEVELGGGGSRVSGGRVSGGRVSGGRVSGGRVSGGRVSGGKDD